MCQQRLCAFEGPPGSLRSSARHEERHASQIHGHSGQPLSYAFTLWHLVVLDMLQAEEASCAHHSNLTKGFFIVYPARDRRTFYSVLAAAQVDNVRYERQPIADHANNLAANIQGNLKRSLEAIGVVCTCCLSQHLHICMIIHFFQCMLSLLPAIMCLVIGAWTCLCLWLQPSAESCPLHLESLGF